MILVSLLLAASSPVITPGFTPHPLEEEVKLKNGDVHVTERFRGFVK